MPKSNLNIVVRILLCGLVAEPAVIAGIVERSSPQGRPNSGVWTANLFQECALTGAVPSAIAPLSEAGAEVDRLATQVSDPPSARAESTKFTYTEEALTAVRAQVAQFDPVNAAILNPSQLSHLLDTPLATVQKLSDTDVIKISRGQTRQLALQLQNIKSMPGIVIQRDTIDSISESADVTLNENQRQEFDLFRRATSLKRELYQEFPEFAAAADMANTSIVFFVDLLGLPRNAVKAHFQWQGFAGVSDHLLQYLVSWVSARWLPVQTEEVRTRQESVRRESKSTLSLAFNGRIALFENSSAGTFVGLDFEKGSDKLMVQVRFALPAKTSASRATAIIKVYALEDILALVSEPAQMEKLQNYLRKLLKIEIQKEGAWSEEEKEPWPDEVFEKYPWLKVNVRNRDGSTTPAAQEIDPDHIATLLSSGHPIIKALTHFGVRTVTQVKRFHFLHVRAIVSKEIPLAPLTRALDHHGIRLNQARKVPALTQIKLTSIEEAWLLLNEIPDFETLKRRLSDPTYKGIRNLSLGETIIPHLLKKLKGYRDQQFNNSRYVLTKALYKALTALQIDPHVDFVFQPVMTVRSQVSIRNLFIFRLFNDAGALHYRLVISPTADKDGSFWAIEKSSSKDLSAAARKTIDQLEQFARGMRNDSLWNPDRKIKGSESITSEALQAAWCFYDDPQRKDNPRLALTAAQDRHPSATLDEIGRAFTVLHMADEGHWLESLQPNPPAIPGPQGRSRGTPATARRKSA